MSRLASPPPEERVLDGSRFSTAWWRFVSRVTGLLSGREPLPLVAFTVATLPDASKWPRCVVIVTDEVGGHTLAVSDGVNWLRVSDGTGVS